MPREEAWHRNLRRTRQISRAALTAAELGIEIPPEVVTAAKGALIDHHATDVDTMLSWTAQQKMMNRDMMNLMNNFAMQNQTGSMPREMAERLDGKATGRGRIRAGTREAAREAKMGARVVKY